MKYFLITIFFTLSIFANEVDIKKLKSEIKNDFSKIKKDMNENNKALLKVIKTNQKTTDKQFKDMNKKLDDTNKQLKDINVKFNLLLTNMNYLIKEDIDKELKIKLTKKVDINLVERVVSVLEEFGKKNSDIANVLKKHNFIVK